MAKTKNKTELLQIRIEPKVKEMIIKQAEANNETITGYITKLAINDYKEANRMKIYTADRETGTLIEECKTIAEALKLIEAYEEADRTEGAYEENFYDVVNEEHMSLLNGNMPIETEALSNTEIAEMLRSNTDLTDSEISKHLRDGVYAYSNFEEFRENWVGCGNDEDAAETIWKSFDEMIYRGKAYRVDFAL